MRLFDLHCDTLGRALNENKDFLNNNFHVDLSKIKNEPYIGCFAIWIPDECRSNAAFELFKKAQKKLVKQNEKYSKYFKIIKNKNDLINVSKYKQKGIIFTVEGGAAIAGKLENIKFLSECGVKIMTLTWNGSCEIGDGVEVLNSKGLSEFGKKTVEKMENQNIIVDVSHASEKLFFNVAEIATKPFIASHSNAKKICGHKRNLTDEQFKIIKNSSGIVGLNFCVHFLNEKREATLSNIFEHTEHFLSLGGENVVCIGSDFDGTDIPKEISDISKINVLADYFLNKNYSENLVKNIFFNNAFEFFKRSY